MAPPPVLDNAREQVAAVDRSAADGARAGTGSQPLSDELAAPDSSVFEGSHRIVNLWVGAGGVTTEIDVWARRTYSNGPALLAGGLGFGEVTEYLGAPANAELVFVGAGAGPDGIGLGGVTNAIGSEQLTVVFAADDRLDGATTVTLWERGSELAPSPPSPGRGLVDVVGVNLSPFDDELRVAFGTDTFSVGIGASCVEQRGETDGFAPAAVGSGKPIEFELAPGPAVITLHPSVDDCRPAPVHEIPVDVVVDAGLLVAVYTTDGTTIGSLVLPFG